MKLMLGVVPTTVVGAANYPNPFTIGVAIIAAVVMVWNWRRHKKRKDSLYGRVQTSTGHCKMSGPL